VVKSLQNMSIFSWCLEALFTKYIPDQVMAGTAWGTI